MTDAALGGPVTVGQRIGTMTLVNGAIARLRAAGLPLLWLFLGTAAFSVGLQLAAKALAINVSTPSLTPGYLFNVVVASAFGGVSSALGLRLLLEGTPGWLRLDRRLAEAASLLSLATLGFMAVSLLMTTGLASAATLSPGVVMARSFGAIFAYVFMAYAWLKLALWPLGRLTGRLDVTPARSWRLMRKATRGYLLALLIALIPFSVLLFVAMQAGGIANMTAPTTLAVSAVGGVAFGLYGQAVIATLFTLRVDAPTSVAEVFA